ncbi:MAG TPA: ABC transporter ATP-binding protein [Steroidobacteraceae bacterium]|nr:ABC transporter ATP-binding protein [Steroidobacteraceae bacterium]
MLSLEGLTHVYPNGTRALEEVSLAIPTGMFGLLGPNGAGKSTLMRCIATLQSPSRGSIRFGDIDVLREPERLRALLGYLPQDFGVYPRVSAQGLLEHLAVLKGISGRGERRETVEALLHQVNLWEVRRKAVAGFSGGMRQRFGIAQALIGAPRLIIVDEPTAGLDPEERQRFNNLLAEIGEHVVVILSTHIVDDVTDLCPNMAIMVGGRIVRAGAPQQLVDTLQGRIWRSLVDKSRIAEVREAQEVISTRLRAGRHEVRVVSGSAPAGFEPAEATLEDLYFATLSAQRHATPGAVPAAAA